MSIRGLGMDFDIGSQIVPVNLATGANTGHRIHMRDYGGVAFVVALATGTAGEAPTIVFRRHNAATSGTSQDHDVVDTYYKKEEATLDGDETWTKVTQTAGDITDADWDDANQVLVVAQIEAASLPDGYEWLSIDIADTGTSHIGAAFAVMYDLAVQRAPEALAQPNA